MISLRTGACVAFLDATAPRNARVGGRLAAFRFVVEYLECGKQRFWDHSLKGVMGEKRPSGASISTAVKAHLSRCPFWDKAEDAAIVLDVGQAGLTTIREAMQFAWDQKDIWLKARDLADGARIVERRLAERYADWDDEAIRIITNHAAYAWR